MLFPLQERPTRRDCPPQAEALPGNRQGPVLAGILPTSLSQEDWFLVMSHSQPPAHRMAVPFHSSSFFSATHPLTPALAPPQKQALLQ